jgi:hypothetical protein
MTYLSARPQRRKKIIRGVFYGALFALFVFFWSTTQPFLYKGIEPLVIKYGATKAGVLLIPEFLKTNTTPNKVLVARNKELEVTIERLENELASKSSLSKESVRSVPSFSSDATSTSFSETEESTSQELVLYPLVEDETKIYSSILLSKGFKDGVEVGKMVYLRGQQAVCTIQQVYTSTALCSLISSSNNTTEAVTSSSSINLSLIGRGGSFVANIARDTPVFVGEKVYLKSDQSMILGTIVQIINNNQDTSWHVFVRGAYNPVTSSIFYMKK